MSNNISPIDWQKLSDFLDGQCSIAEKQEIETLISTNKTWQEGYQSLAKIRTLLRLAPKRRAPKNFTLTAAMVGSTRSIFKPIFTFRLVSAFSTAMAVVVIAIGVFTGRNPAVIPLAATTFQEKAAAEVINPPQIIIWGPPGAPAQTFANQYAYGMGGGGGRGGGGGGVIGGGDGSVIANPAAVEVPQPATADALPMESAPESLAEPAEIAPEPAMPEAPAAAEPSASKMTASPTQAAAAQPILSENIGSSPILGIQPAGDLTSTGQNVEQPKPVLSIWNILAAIFLFIAILTGIFSLVFARKPVK